MVPGKNCPWWLESDDGGRAAFGCGLGRPGSGDVTVGETPPTGSMAAPQWRQNRLSWAISREQDRHLNMRVMLPEHVEKIEAQDTRNTPRVPARCPADCPARLAPEQCVKDFDYPRERREGKPLLP